MHLGFRVAGVDAGFAFRPDHKAELLGVGQMKGERQAPAPAIRLDPSRNILI